MKILESLERRIEQQGWGWCHVSWTENSVIITAGLSRTNDEPTGGAGPWIEHDRQVTYEVRAKHGDLSADAAMEIEIWFKEHLTK